MNLLRPLQPVSYTHLIASRHLIALIGFLALVACGESSKKPPLLGERVAVLQQANALAVAPVLAQTTVELPDPQFYTAWPQAGAFPDHVRSHLALGGTVSLAWNITIGSGSSRESALQTLPIVADDKVFTVDSAGYVNAHAVRNGNLLWRSPTLPKDEEDPTISGTLATADGNLYVATAAAELVAFEIAGGKELWRKPLPAPVRVAPTIADNRIFVITLDNQTIALSLEDGQQLWKHSGIGEIAGLLGGGAPAVSGDSVIVPYSSGELFALRAENGHVLWADNLSGLRQANAVAGLTNIRGNPAIDRGVVFAASHAGRLAAIELRTGERIWERELPVDQDPWVAGDYVFIVTTRGEVAALTRTAGQVRWVHVLPRFTDETEQKNPIHWSGPVLAGDRLFLTNTRGKIVVISPYTGEFLGETEIPGSTTLPPIVVGNALYVLTEEGRLAAYR